ncbi:MAG: aldolase [Comamonadaceae bacterium]|nr:aldolase [Comamonadaceae bacterium]
MKSSTTETPAELTAKSLAAIEQIQGKLDYGTWTQNERIALSCRLLAANGHAETLAGQLTVRQDDGTFMTVPLGRGFFEVRASNLIRIDKSMQVIEGSGAANPAIRFHLWVYNARPDVRCIVHTHPPYVAALSMTGQPLKVAHMDATPFFDDCAFLPTWPGLPMAEEEGEIISRALGPKRSILLANHGFLTATPSIEESLYLAILLERCARNQLRAAACGSIAELDADLARESHDFLLRPEIVKTTFATMSREYLAGKDVCVIS